MREFAFFYVLTRNSRLRTSTCLNNRKSTDKSIVTNRHLFLSLNHTLGHSGINLGAIFAYPKPDYWSTNIRFVAHLWLTDTLDDVEYTGFRLYIPKETAKYDQIRGFKFGLSFIYHPTPATRCASDFYQFNSVLKKQINVPNIYLCIHTFSSNCSVDWKLSHRLDITESIKRNVWFKILSVSSKATPHKLSAMES